MSEDVNLSGVWEGSYAYSSSDVGELEFKLRLKEIDGQLRGLAVEPHTEMDGNRRAEIEGTRNNREISFVKNTSTMRPQVMSTPGQSPMTVF